MPIFYFVPDREADTFKMPLTAERLLRSLGTTGKLAGFRCTVYMIERIQEDPEQLQLITKRLYKETGKKFGVSAASVERTQNSDSFLLEPDRSQLFRAYCGNGLENPAYKQRISRHACQLFARNGWLKRGEALASPLSMSMEVDPMRSMLIAVGHYRQEWTVF